MQKITTATKEKRGRGRPPKPGGVFPTLPVRVPPKTIEAVDTFAERAGISRSEAVRRLVDLGLKAGRRPAK
jgi:hypothetical protein